ncbi:hypothetical protein CAEBREN_19817 [Caenorhabditis brenneri]|uniref:SPK domain-containing protein n=1 Tax=Caenorhabditis brenneri TaxID=135651 RepID=G0MW29_CAEBE|nr:hypothetical protein CAEBREN_19817 [Caenorhabditis brenneri]
MTFFEEQFAGYPYEFLNLKDRIVTKNLWKKVSMLMKKDYYKNLIGPILNISESQRIPEILKYVIETPNLTDVSKVTIMMLTATPVPKQFRNRAKM